MSDRASSSPPEPVLAPQQNSETTEANAKEEPVEEDLHSVLSPTVSVEPKAEATPPSPSKSNRKTKSAQRRAILLEDPLVGEAEPHQVYCRGCEKWIRLSALSQYTLANWHTHKLRCPRSPGYPTRRARSKPQFSPNSRVATAERQIVLLNDPQVKDFSTGEVHCRSCTTVVPLEGEVDYDLTKWTEHKATCIPKTPGPITPEGSRPRTFPPPSTSSTRSQVSVGEGSSTGQSAESPPVAVKAGMKRGRDDEGEEEGARPTRRPRGPGSGVLGWLMHPLNEFARGFREGLASST